MLGKKALVNAHPSFRLGYEDGYTGNNKRTADYEFMYHNPKFNVQEYEQGYSVGEIYRKDDHLLRNIRKTLKRNRQGLR